MLLGTLFTDWNWKYFTLTFPLRKTTSQKKCKILLKVYDRWMNLIRHILWRAQSQEFINSQDETESRLTFPHQNSGRNRRKINEVNLCVQKEAKRNLQFCLRLICRCEFRVSSVDYSSTSRVRVELRRALSRSNVFMLFRTLSFVLVVVWLIVSIREVIKNY